jgi:hypothetical protein
MTSHFCTSNRRQLLKTLALSAPGMTIAMNAAMAGIETPQKNQRNLGRELSSVDTENAYRRLLDLRYGSRGKVTYWWLQGRRYASIDNALIPLFDIWVGFAYRRSALNAESEQIQARSRVLYTELGSHELLQSWLNPISGRRVEFNYADPVTQTQRYLIDRGLVRETLFENTTQERVDTITGLRQLRERVFIDEEAQVRIFDRHNRDRPPRKVHDRYMWSGRSVAQEKDQTIFADAEVSFMDVTDWSPRLGMGEVVGCAIAHCSGRRTVTLDEFPDAWHSLHTRHQLGSLGFDEP